MANLDDQEYLRAIGLRIRLLREAAGLTQAELAQRCGLHRTFIGSVERGERNVAILSLRKIAQALRVGVEAFLVTHQDTQETQPD